MKATAFRREGVRSRVFSASETLAIRDGRKTMFREVIEPQPEDYRDGYPDGYDCPPHSMVKYKGQWIDDGDFIHEYCPSQVGDRLWVGEVWAIYSSSVNFVKENQLRVAYRTGVGNSACPKGMNYDLEWRTVDWGTWSKYAARKYSSWKSPMCMPHWASRIVREIVSVRAERLQEIEPGEAAKEGWPKDAELFPTVNTEDKLMRWFKALWDSRNPEYPWDTNPWVWVRGLGDCEVECLR